jgi:hypothetical protein
MCRSVIVTLLLAGSVTAGFQPLSGQSRAQEIAAAFTKHKFVVKEAHGVQREKFKDVWSEPTVRANVGDYSGVYEVAELGNRLTVQVDDDGTVRASGSDGEAESRRFDLKNAKIQGALLTGTKVFLDGTTERLEAAFLTRTDRDSLTDPGTTVYGLGIVLRSPVELNGTTHDKLFYQLKR